MSMERNLILALLEKHFRTLQALVNAKVERNVTLMDVMAKVRELYESGRSINNSEYSSKLSRLT